MSDTPLFLSQAEADRFAAWLEREAETGRAILRQLESLPPNVAAPLIEREKRDIAAALIIARRLRSTERVEINPTESGKTR